MIRSGGKINIPILDGFRALAILIVLIYHLGLSTYFYPLQLIDAGGWMGVQLFFVLSGFLLSLDYLYAAKNRIDIPLFSEFYRNRVLRIFPLYFLGLSVYILLNYFKETFTNLPGLLSYFVFMQNFYPENWPVYDSYWSLAVEVQIYLIFPMIGYGLYKTIKESQKSFLILYLAMLCVAPLLYRIYFSVLHTDSMSEQYYIRWIYKSSFSNLDSFGWGIIGAVIYIFWDPTRLHLALVWIVKIISIGIIIGLFHYSMTHRSWYLIDGYFAPAIFYTLINFSWITLIVTSLLTQERLITKIVCSNLVKFIAKISFGLYVWHGIAYYATRKLAKFLVIQDRILLNGFLLVVAMTLTVTLASLTYYFVEMPFLRLKSKRVESKKAVG